MKLQVIQAEYDGIPQEPSVFTDESKAFDHYQDKVQVQGFRAKHDNEDQIRYVQRYNTWLADKKIHDPIRWWEIIVPLSEDIARNTLIAQGSFGQNIWTAGDIRGTCKQHDLPNLTDEQVIQVWDRIGDTFNPEYGINWEVIEGAIHHFSDEHKQKAYVEFNYLGSTHRYKCLPEDDDWRISFVSNDLTFDLHYHAEINEIRVFELVNGARANEGKPVHKQTIQSKG